MMFVTDFADQAVVLPVVLTIAVLLALQGWRRGALVWLGVVSGTFAVMLSLKLASLACPPMLEPIAIRSPSGHVAAATVVAGGLAALLTRQRAAILPVAVLAGLVIGVSRLVLGMHSVAEVAVGALVGLAGAGALLTLAGAPPDKLQPRRLLAAAAVVAVIFHGLHLPAEAAIRDTAARAAEMLAVCQPQDLPSDGGLQIRGG